MTTAGPALNSPARERAIAGHVLGVEAATDDRPTVSQAGRAFQNAARTMIAARGHVIGTTIHEERGWAVKCAVCDHWATYVLGDEDPVTGYLVRQECPGHPLG